jgi:hypothetical protein
MQQLTLENVKTKEEQESGAFPSSSRWQVNKCVWVTHG